MSADRVVGWDIGGANTKAALAVGESLRAVTRPFPIWEDPGGLRRVLSEIAAELGPADAMAVTMTAELADCFGTKREGVGFVLDALESTFPDTPLYIFAVDGGFRSVEEARGVPLTVASANWAATPRLLARQNPDALVIDVGSTTADIVPIVRGELAVCGMTDPERLASGELVYTGAVRTPVCAIARTVPLRGQRCRVASEFFAQAGDAHLWLGHLSERDYVGRTPDGRGVSREEARARLARVVCADASMLAGHEITAMAEYLFERQVRQIAAGVRQVQARLGKRAPRGAITAGLGSFLARAAATRAGLESHDLAAGWGEAASGAAPAVAVARLLQEARR